MNVSSSYLSHIDGFCHVDSNAISSKYSMYTLTNTGDNGERIASPCSCRYISDPIPKYVVSTQKDGIPLRPIVDNRGSACHPLSRLLVEINSPLTGKSSSYVKNLAHFVERISDALIHSNQLESLDIVSLFTKVSTDETLAVVRDKLAADPLLEERTCIPIDNLMEMLTYQPKLCENNNEDEDNSPKTLNDKKSVYQF